MNETKPPQVFKCAGCGMESTVERAFTRTRGLFSAGEIYCPRCQLKRQTRTTIIYYLLLPVLGVLLILSGMAPLQYYGWMLVYITAALVFMIPLILLHELAHAAVAWLVGLRVFTIVLGMGRTLFSFRFLGILWDVRPLPLGGATFVSGPRSHLYRLRLFLTYLAGPLVHLALTAGLVVAILPLLFHPVNGWTLQALGLALMVNLLLFLGNIYPRKTASNVGTTGTDGWQMVKLFSLTEADLRQRDVSYYAFEPIDAYRKGNLPLAKEWIGKGMALYADEPLILNTRGFLQVQEQDFGPARETFLALLGSACPISPELRLLAFNNVAFANLMLNDPALLPEADEKSAEAFKNIPWEPAIQGTRGAVLVRLGRAEEGIPLLKTALSQNPDKKGKAIEAYFIAEGEAARGNTVEAEKYLGMARAMDPKCPLLEQTVQVVGKNKQEMHA